MIIPFLMTMKKKQDLVDMSRNREVVKHHIRLSDELLEISGLVPFQEGFIAINDGGPDNRLYVLDQNGEILRRIVVDTENNDWEALTIGDGNLYIGDVGNNFGLRDSLRLIEVNLDHLYKDTLGANDFSVISFKTPWSSEWINEGKHDMDCEAMVYRANKMHLFSKNRLSDEVVHVVLNMNRSDSIQARMSESVRIKGQITDACFTEDGALLLLGYKAPSYKSFIVRFGFTEGDYFFHGDRKKYMLGSFPVYGQSEAICIDQKGMIRIGSEGNRKMRRRARLHIYTLSPESN